MKDIHQKHVGVGDTVATGETEDEEEEVEGASDIPSLLGEALNFRVVNKNNRQVDQAENFLRRQFGQ